jgi:protoheme IX farnesyltransferase
LIVGSFGIVGAANAVNCWLERDVDALMTRTAERPLATGRIDATHALIFALVLAAASLALLYFGNNDRTAALGLLGFLSYVAIYTPMKRHSMNALFSGAIPGAIPPLMGWVAVRGHIELGAWILFGILFFWQMPHFIAISIFRQTEYDHAGLKTVPGTLGTESARHQILLFTGLLGMVSLLPYVLGLAGPLYLVTALATGVAFLIPAILGLSERGQIRWVRAVFFGSLAYLPVVLGMWVIDQWIGNWAR